MTLAIVIVFPEPVTPSSVWNRSPRAKPADSSAIAFGWSPAGWKGAWRSNSARGIVRNIASRIGVCSGAVARTSCLSDAQPFATMEAAPPSSIPHREGGRSVPWRTRRLNRAPIIWSLLYLLLCLVMLVIGLETALHFHGPAIDGPFQLYNSLRRISGGSGPESISSSFMGLVFHISITSPFARSEERSSRRKSPAN